jgi:hypothetical protein
LVENLILLSLTLHELLEEGIVYEVLLAVPLILMCDPGLDELIDFWCQKEGDVN